MDRREQHRAILHTAVESLLDYLDDEYPEGIELGVAALVCEIEYGNGDGERTALPYWCSDSRRFVQHGLLSMAAHQTLE